MPQTGADNSGNEFYLTALENYHWDRHSEPLSFNISLATEEDSPVNVTITIKVYDDKGNSGPQSESVMVQPGHLTTVQLPADEITLGRSSDRDRGIHIKAENNKTILVTGKNEFIDFGSMDAFLALPVPTAENKSQHFTYIAGMIPNQPFDVNIGIVAYTDNTELLITPTQTTTIGNRRNRTPRGSTVSERLDKGETLLIANLLDLSGTRVVSSYPVAFFIGSQCANVPADASSCDHLVEQIPPVEQWGMEFITAPLATRRKYDVFKIVASNNNTEVHIHCNRDINATQTPQVLDAGEFTTFNIPSSASCYINASEKVLLLQFSASQSVDNITRADPFMAMVPSISQYSNSFTLMTVSSTQTMLYHYINIYILSQYFDRSNIMLDAHSLKDIGTMFEPVTPRMGSSTPIAYVAKVSITAGLHTLKHTTRNAKMGVLVYGFGKGTSYGYPGGLALGMCV